MTALSYQRETSDWRGLVFRELDTSVDPPVRKIYTGSWSYQIVAKGARPVGTWLSAVTRGVAKGIDIVGLAAGYYWVFVRVEGQSPYAPKLDPIDLVIK